METVPMIVWTVLKAAVLPISAAFVAYWLTGSESVTIGALASACVLELAVCVYCGMRLGKAYDEERRE